ncbi:MAG TPA: TIGR03621 family F420-dependent LLM class oxidoreductase, partial [Candidatus Nitrosotenuis sp.]|nr:TIGR03621 family F420-dependent LLM class oxidoreductase [Candidatus Nitrosotenuis sp.]
MRAFRFGIQYLWARSRAEWRAKVQQAEDWGFDVVLMPDHFPLDLAVVPAMMCAAEVSSRLRFGSLVFDNDFRHPLVLAREVATLDLLTEGRFEMGLGAGWLPDEYQAAGLAFDRPGERIDRLAEGVALIKGAFTGEKFSYQGQFYQAHDYVGQPRPVQRPHPPLLIGGGGQRVLSLAAREADIVSLIFPLTRGGMGPGDLPVMDDAALATRLGWLKEAASQRFGDLELNLPIFWGAITDDPRKAAEPAARALGYTVDQALASHNLLFATLAGAVEELERRRQQFGISYF